MKLEFHKKRLIASCNNGCDYDFSQLSNNEVQYGEQKFDVQVSNALDGQTFISVNGISYPVEVLSQKQNTYDILVNGVSYTFSIETPLSLKRKKIVSSFKVSSKNVSIKAPMPGKILDVTVAEGNTVNSGDILLVLEAMKMQNTIVSHVKGVIRKVTVKPNDLVNKNDLLVDIEKS